MKTILKIISFAALALCILPALLVLNGTFDLQTHYRWTLAGTILWFVTAPFWVDRKKKLPG